MKISLIKTFRRSIDQSAILIGFSVIVSSCVHHQEADTTGDQVVFEDSVKVTYAEGFDINYLPGYVELITHSIHQNSFFADTLFLLTDSLKADPAKQYTNHQLNSIICQSSTHIAFLEVLDELNRVTGLCGLDYVQNPEVREKLLSNNVSEICLAEQVSLEAIQRLDPDLFLIYPFETTGKDKYDALGIQSFYIAEYLETSPLARLEWIKLFGLLLNKTKEANTYFETVESDYKQFKKPHPDSSKTFILNLPFKDNWHMPSGNSLIVNLIEDAGLKYYYQESGSTENDLHSTEEVWNDAMFAEYWIIMAFRPADFSMKDLLAEEPVYAKFRSVTKNQVIFCNTATSSYFSSGIVEPQVMLKDLLYATGQLASHEPEYFFLLK